MPRPLYPRSDQMFSGTAGALFTRMGLPPSPIALFFHETVRMMNVALGLPVTCPCGWTSVRVMHYAR